MKYPSRSCRLCPGVLRPDVVQGHNVTYSCFNCDSYEVSLYNPTLSLRHELFKYDNIYVNCYYACGEIDFYHLYVVNEYKSQTNISKIIGDKEEVSKINFNPLNPSSLIDKLKTLILFS